MSTESQFKRLEGIIRRLRQECPWDSEQTHESLRQSLIEEAYEAVEAIDYRDLKGLGDELGDLLLHVILHSVIAEESGAFSLKDVIERISEKLVRRHPHIYGSVTVNGKEEVKKNWEQIKLEEGRTSRLDGIPSSLPALVRANRLQEKASKVGFDWKNKEDCWKKVLEELEELQSTLGEGQDHSKTEEELGDLLFSIVNYARFLGINPEDALRHTNNKFQRRFQIIENELARRGVDINTVSLEEMDKIWEMSKDADR